jgi:hypothetical protein
MIMCRLQFRTQKLKLTCKACPFGFYGTVREHSRVFEFSLKVCTLSRENPSGPDLSKKRRQTEYDHTRASDRPNDAKQRFIHTAYGVTECPTKQMPAHNTAVRSAACGHAK